MKKELSNLQELKDSYLVSVHQAEDTLEIGEGKRWRKGDPNYTRILALIEDAEFQKAVDRVMELVTQRLMELAKMGHSGTGEFGISITCTYFEFILHCFLNKKAIN